MGRSISRTEKRGRGRPRVNPTSIHLSLSPGQLHEVDGWVTQQPDKPSRPEAIRRLLWMALASEKGMTSLPRKKTAAKASELAGATIDQLGDKSAQDHERAKRKRRLLKGPSEFRDIRDDLPKRKR
jgi:hypothetical protein